jgi:hypothetical protein
MFYQLISFFFSIFNSNIFFYSVPKTYLKNTFFQDSFQNIKKYAILKVRIHVILRVEKFSKS